MENVKMQKQEEYIDIFRGCIVGGAAGDALGYPVEFISCQAIQKRYGDKGITEYSVDIRSGKALISDDTQMTLFTAAGLLVCRAHGGDMSRYAASAYQDWLATQCMSYSPELRPDGVSWLLDVPELYSRRAPGSTCISALEQRKKGADEVLNSSKGCGGVMRIAPVALACFAEGESIGFADEAAAEIAAITHGHPLGYISAAALTHIIYRICEGKSISAAVMDSVDAIEARYSNDAEELVRLMYFAVELAENGQDDISNINELGEGWVAEEALAIAVYCALKYENDFSGGITAAVNHSGDSDSTGAITGNILGAYIGFDGIDEKWKNDLELYKVILEIADDLCGCSDDEAMRVKYIETRRVKDFGALPLRVIRGNITKVSNAEAIVNAANNSLLGGGGVDGAIHAAAGPGLLNECRKLNGCHTGGAKITWAYDLPCRYVIHTVGPIWRGGMCGEDELLAECYRNSLMLAVERGIRTIAFPSIATGAYGFPEDRAARIALKTAMNFIDVYPGVFELIEWVLFEDRTYRIYETELDRLYSESGVVIE